MSSELKMCYISRSLQLRANMAGSADETTLPPKGSSGAAAFESAARKFDGLAVKVESALKKAAEAHSGRAAEAAKASISEIKPIAEHAAETSRNMKKSLEGQAQSQTETFQALPARGGKLADGRQTQMEPPEKNWAERNGVDDWPGLGWSSDYEEKQARFQATNDEAQQAMSRYKAQTASTTQGLPEFKPPEDSGPTGRTQGDYGRGAGEIMSGTSYGGSGSAGTTSAWAAGPSAAGAGAGVGSAAAGGSYVSSGASAGSAVPSAGTGSAWSTPPGTVRGPDGTLYRQGSDGNWQRQNPYNGRWAPSPQGPPGTAGGAGGARGGGAAPRGGAGAGGRAGGGFGPRGSGSSELAPGGRSGTGSFGPKSSGTTPTTAGGGASGGRGNGTMRGAGGGGGAQQGGEEEEHERPSWLMESEDVFTNDMQRVAPPVIGETPYEQGN